MRGVLGETLKHFRDRKLVWVFGFLTVVGGAIMATAANVIMENLVQPMGIDAEMGQMVQERVLLSFDVFMSIVLFIVVIATAGIIPHFTAQGQADFYLSKPISRTRLLLSKLVCAWLVYSLAVVVCGALVYGAISAAVGSITFRVLWLLLGYVFLLAVWLSVTSVAAVLSGSTPVSIMAAFLTWLFQAILTGHTTYVDVIKADWLDWVVEGLYYVLPKHSEVGALCVDLGIGKPVESSVPLWSTAIFAVVMYAIALYVFRRKNY